MKQKLLLTLILILVSSLIVSCAPSINAVRSVQRSGTDLVDIFYNLSDNSGPNLYVSVELSTNNGLTYNLKLSSLSGDAGYNIKPGLNKHIVWNAGIDKPNTPKTTCRIKIIATTLNEFEGQMINIPAGSFVMGNSGIGDDSIYGVSNEIPKRIVYLDKYQIGKYEVTRGEYRRFIEAGGYTNPIYWTTESWAWKTNNERTEPEYWQATQDWGNGAFTQTDYHPVVGVTYFEAQAYCKWAGGRLPSEAEWEKAARWNGSNSNIYPWGDTWNQEKCNNYDDSNTAGGGLSKYRTAPVGSYPSGVSAYGCNDIAGNVWEWCADWYKSYPASTNPFDFTDLYRCVRGGGWSYNNFYSFRCAYRSYSTPSNYDYLIGFRIAR